MKITKTNWYGLDHAAVARQFEGDLTFINSFDIKGEYHPVAVYHAAKPNRAKGHKEYMLLIVSRECGVVRGMEREELQVFAKRPAIHCLDCDEVVFSCMRHDAAQCTCKKVMIDGGSDYVRSSINEDANARFGTVNLLTDKFTPTRKKKS